eukprot:scaffold77827_cov42-Attheya_sp.AAC.1
MANTDNELVLYSQRKLSLIEEAVRLAIMLPTLAQAEEMVESSQWLWDERLPGQIDVQRDVPAVADATETITALAGDSFDELPEGGTMLDINHGCSDIPHDVDLNTEKAVRELLSCVVRLRNEALKETNQEDDVIVEPPISKDAGGFLLCDGAPAEMSARIKDGDSNSDSEQKYEHVRCFAMGFHFLLHAHRGTGLLFGETHLNHAVGQWRNTFKQIQWYLFPGDPNQTDRKKPEYIFAHYVAAARKCAELKGTNELSSVEVWDHMMSRAKEHPLLFVILMELNYADISFMIRDSEKNGERGDCNLFLAAVKLLAPLFTVTHATGYVRLSAEYERWRRCASEADLKIFEYFLFTKRTVNGSSIFSDRFVEWMVKAYRHDMKKHVRPGHRKRLLTVGLDLNERLLKRGSGAASRITGMDELKRLRVSPVFCKTLLAIEKMNLYGTGPLKNVKTGADLPAYATPDGKDFINPEMIYAYSVGIARFDQYLHRYYIQTMNEQKRSDNEVPLHTIPPLQSNLKMAAATLRKLKTTTHEGELSDRNN